MGQVTWRASDELIGRVRRAAVRRGWSMNEMVTRALEAVTNPDLAGDEAHSLRERLDRAGLLAPPGPPKRRPPAADVAAARRHAGQGAPLSDIVSQQRG